MVSGVVKRAQSIETSPLSAAHGHFWRCAWFPVDCAHFHRTAHHPRVLEPTTGQPGECVRFGCWMLDVVCVGRQCVDLSWGGGRFATVPPAVSPSMIFPLCTRLEPSRGGVVGEFFRAAKRDHGPIIHFQPPRRHDDDHRAPSLAHARAPDCPGGGGRFPSAPRAEFRRTAAEQQPLGRRPHLVRLPGLELPSLPGADRGFVLPAQLRLVRRHGRLVLQHR